MKRAAKIAAIAKCCERRDRLSRRRRARGHLQAANTRDREKRRSESTQRLAFIDAIPPPVPLSKVDVVLYRSELADFT